MTANYIINTDQNESRGKIRIFPSYLGDKCNFLSLALSCDHFIKHTLYYKRFLIFCVPFSKIHHIYFLSFHRASVLVPGRKRRHIKWSCPSVCILALHPSQHGCMHTEYLWSMTNVFIQKFSPTYLKYAHTTLCDWSYICFQYISEPHAIRHCKCVNKHLENSNL